MGSRKLTWLALAISIYLNLSVCQSICLRFYVFHLSAPLYPSFPFIHFHPSIHPSMCLYLYPYIPLSISKSLNPCLETRSLSISKYLDLHVSFHLYYIHTSIYLSIYIYIHLPLSSMHASMTSWTGSAQKRRPNHTGKATFRYTR